MIVAFAALVACGSVDAARDDAGPSYDAAPGISDANGADAQAPDARPPVTGPPSQELTSGGMRVNGGNYRVDVQLGHSFGQAPIAGADKSVQGAAAIKE